MEDLIAAELNYFAAEENQKTLETKYKQACQATIQARQEFDDAYQAVRQATMDNGALKQPDGWAPQS
jgi:hypothetical protein